MYSTLGKSLVEFVANAYDSDASRVEITIPAEEIEVARREVRRKAKDEVVVGAREAFSVLLAALPEELQVIITDDGHGMAPEDIKNKFLPINRRRRADKTGVETNFLSESRVRYVMGRKGLGKLAGFGAAERVTVTTKRKGEGFSTTFTMDFNALKNSENLMEVLIPAEYMDGLPEGDHGTTIVLSLLRCDAVKYGMDTLKTTLADAFYGIEPEDFEILVNKSRVVQAPAEYEFYYPEDRSVDGLARGVVAVEDLGDVEFDYVVKFRNRGNHLQASRRGARIYCNKRLAAGPSLFGLPTGMHNFHSQSYMECIVRADQLDRYMVDLVSTNRTQLREDTEVVQVLLNEVGEIMRKALSEHGKFRDRVIEDQIESDPETRHVARIVDRMPSKTRMPAKRLLKALALQHGVDSVEFQELAPLVIDTMNAGEVLIRLIELGTDPGTVENVASHLRDLADIEKSDALKLFRGRRSGIVALQKLAEKGDDLWKKQGIEKELHDLFKKEPWLIKPEYSRFLTSDQDLGKVATKLAKNLGVDEFTPILKAGKVDETRPDLVFLMADSDVPHVINVVELKSPTLPLEMDHLNQLKSYMMKIEDFMQQELNRAATVHGYLIGARPHGDKMSDGSRLLLREIKDSGPESKWQVFGIRQLMERALQIHLDVIRALEKDLGEEEDADEAALLPMAQVRKLGAPRGKSTVLAIANSDKVNAER